MLPHEYETMRMVEDAYWWYHVLRGMTCREVERIAKGDSDFRILDAGCGTGGTLDALRRTSPKWFLSGFDFSPLAIEHTRQRGFSGVLEGSVDAIPFPDASQDLIISMDVLCCDGLDQEKSMDEFRRVLKKDGILIMNLPAFDVLRGRHDYTVNSVRRYTPGSVSRLHERHGFAMEKVFCWNAWLFLPILMWRQLSKRLPSAKSSEAKSDLVPPPQWLNKAMTRIGGWDATICQTLRSPIGTSVFSIAKVKPEI